MINLASKYSDIIDKKFTHSSFIAGKVSNQYDFTGVKTVQVLTPQTVELNDYNRTLSANRYGTPTEMQDSLQELTLTQDKGFALTIDKGNKLDQLGIKEASKMLGLQIDERVTPTADKYAFDAICQKAGTVEALASAPTKTTIVERLFAASAVLDNNLVPDNERYLYIPASYYNYVRLSPEFIGVDKLGEAALSRGVVGEIAGMRAVKVPDSYLPSGCYFIIAYKNSLIMPFKMRDSKVHQDPPGISGALLEGRYYYDLFVLGSKANGVYAAVDKVLATPTATASGNGYTLSATSGAEILYTTDGTDPRYSATAKTYTSGVVQAEEGGKVRAYAKQAGAFPSAVLEK